ncbi:hypothetical protein BJY52DRAFT_1234909 [Lactarius psammicola]|nr:hypothetical protein BJY52DRAFT_1234909 [Lactarius psammicola]
MSARYAPLPNTQTDPLLNDEMEAAFEEDDDDDDDVESRPLNPAAYSSPPRTPTPGRYDFENFDYASLPPPGSPPRPSSSALPNDIGNSNGFVPSPSDVRHVDAPRPNWFRRSARVILPNALISRLHLDYEPMHGVVGGGTNNDGVFANVTAKPTRPVQLRSGDDVHLVPEDSQKDAPPSYASAQADAVPPYWETTVHAPSSPDDMIIDHLPTGSVFSFLWNLLISISFQFVGFLLTYLLHTTHAARFGSRAGLGVTLIQYGFALRTRVEEDPSGNDWWGVGGGPYGNGMQGDVPSKPTFGTKEEAEEYYRKLNITMGTIPGATMDDINNFANEATTDWLSFFLMTIGWFILITSLLSFWRVKRWERNILASQRETTVSARDAAGSGSSSPLSAQLHRMVGLPIRDVGSLLRTGLGFSRRSHEDPQDSERHGGDPPAEGGRAVPLTPITPSTGEETSRRELIIEMYAHDPDRQRQIIQAFRDDDQLISDMRAAGML